MTNAKNTPTARLERASASEIHAHANLFATQQLSRVASDGAMNDPFSDDEASHIVSKAAVPKRPGVQGRPNPRTQAPRDPHPRPQSHERPESSSQHITHPHPSQAISDARTPSFPGDDSFSKGDEIPPRVLLEMLSPRAFPWYHRSRRQCHVLTSMPPMRP